MRIGDHQPEIDAFLREYFPEPAAEPRKNGRAHGLAPEDDAIIGRCRKARNAAKFSDLFDAGDISGYGSASEADLALISILAFYTQDREQLDRLYRRSALYRGKWERRDYRARTIDRALMRLTETYSWPEKGAADDGVTVTVTPNSHGNGNAGSESKDGRRLRPIRFREMGEPKPRRDVLEGLVPEAYPAMIYGDGGVAKSLLALSAAMAAGRGAGNFLGREIMHTPVGFLDFELDAEEQCRRAVRLAAGDGLSHPPDDLLYMCALGMKPRDAFGDALEACKEAGAKLLIADSLSVAMEGDVEAARDVIGFYQSVIAPFREAGIGVLALDHQSKLQPGERYQNKRAFGSVFKSNLARSVIQVEATEREESSLTLRLRQVKFNFGPLAKPFGAKLSFEADRITLQPVELSDTELSEEATLTARERVRLALDALGEGTPNEIHERLADLTIATVKKELTSLRKLNEVEETGEARARQQVLRPTVTVTEDYKGNGNGNGGPNLEEKHAGTRRLTVEEVEKVRQLEREGMSPRLARREVLGEGA